MPAFGLLGLLVVVGIVFYLMFGGSGGGAAGTAQKAQQSAQQQTYSAVGRDKEGAPVTDSLTYETNDKGILVTAVTPGGAMDAKYGLMPGDVILEVGPLTTKDMAGDAKGLLMQGHTRSEPIVVQRGTQRLTLPLAAAQTPGTPMPAPVQRTTPRNQLEGILKGRPDNNPPTH